MHRRDRALWAAAILAAALPFMGFWLYGQFDIDEGYYAAVVTEMLRTGDWITPRYNGIPWFEKPMMTYWLAGGATSAFGPELGMRLPSVLAGFGLCLVCGWFLTKRVSALAGRWGAVVLATSFLYAAICRMLLADAILCLCVSCSLMALFLSLEGDKRWRLAAGAFVGLGVLTKGPVAILLFGGVAAAAFFFIPKLRPGYGRAWTLVFLSPIGFPEPLSVSYPYVCAFSVALGLLIELRSGEKGLWLSSVVVACVVLSTWYVPVYLANRQVFIEEFVYIQNVLRFFGGDEAHRVPWWSHPIYYPLVILLGGLPWSPWILRSIRTDWRNEDGDCLKPFLLCWSGVVVLFFTLSGSKLPHYVMPAMPPLAMLVAVWLAGRQSGRRVRGIPVSWAGASLATFILANAGFLIAYRALGQQEAHALARWLSKQDGNVILYRLSGAGPTGPQLKIKEGSLPSLVAVIGRNVRFVDDPRRLVASPVPAWIFTRANRLSARDMSYLRTRGITLTRAPAPIAQERFEVYRMSRESRLLAPTAATPAEVSRPYP